MSTFSQQSFSGGMNLLANDVNLDPTQYRLGLNFRNRFGKLEPIASGVLDVSAPYGIKQEILTFGEYIVLFCAGYCYYRHYTATGWKRILGFQMSSDAPRFWTAVVPITTSKYIRKLVTAGSASGGASENVFGGVALGSLSGIVVQDNINQPQFIYVDQSTGLPTSRVLQTYDQWDWSDSGGDLTSDNREYVPIGNSMAWADGILYITAQDGQTIYRSVEGRPLDFVINIDINGDKGGDASTTAYSVGVGGITTLRQMSTGGLFVAAGNNNFLVTKNQTPGAPTLFGQYTFIRKFLFNATCLSDRCIIDSLGDTRFIDLTGVRSFNAILQTENEGRNSVFSKGLSSIFRTSNGENLIQSSVASAAILYDNYELYAVNTIIGPVIAVFDTLNQSWVGFDTLQAGGSLVKMLAKIELTVQRLYGITTDDKVYTFYRGTVFAPLIRTLSISSNTLSVDGNAIPKDWEHKLTTVKCTFINIDTDFTASVTPLVQNELTLAGTIQNEIPYNTPALTYSGVGMLQDVNTNIRNENFQTLDCAVGLQTYCIITWTSKASLSQITFEAVDGGPINSVRSQN